MLKGTSLITVQRVVNAISKEWSHPVIITLSPYAEGLKSLPILVVCFNPVQRCTVSNRFCGPIA